MSGHVGWIAAEADDGDGGRDIEKLGEQRRSGQSSSSGCWQNLPQHNFPSGEEILQAAQPESALDRDPDIWLYRKKTTALLRRYMRWSLEAGRVPSLLGRELFRAKITAYTATTFEERVIFLHDVEGCLDQLHDFDRQLIARVVLQEYDHEAAARILQCNRRTLIRRLPELIDELSEIFLDADLLTRLPETNQERP